MTIQMNSRPTVNFPDSKVHWANVVPIWGRLRASKLRQPDRRTTMPLYQKGIPVVFVDVVIIQQSLIGSMKTINWCGASQVWDFERYYNMIVVFFPGFDRFTPGFDRFIPGFDRFIPASISVTGTLPPTIQIHISQYNVYCFVFWNNFISSYLK